MNTHTDDDQHLGPEPIKDGKVPTEKFARQELNRWKSEICAVPSAYSPSGITPGISYFALILSVPLAIVISTVATIIVIPVASFIGSIGGIALLFIPRIIVKAMNLKDALAPALNLTATVISNAISSLSVGMSIGIISGFIVSKSGRLTKNRNPHVASLFATVAVIIFIVSLAVFHPYHIKSLPLAEFPMWLKVFSIIIASASAVLMAVVFGSFDAEVPFCETHNKYLIKKRLPPLSFRAAKHAIKAIKKHGNVEFVRRLSGEKGNRGLPTKYECPICHAGFIELKIQFCAAWGEGKFLSESWIAASVPIDMAVQSANNTLHVGDSA